MGRRYISPEVAKNICMDIASAIVAQQLNYSRIAERYGVTSETVAHYHKRDKDKSRLIDAYLKDKRSLEADMVERLAQATMERYVQVLPDMTANVVPSAAGIFIDKARLYRGEPTEINQTAVRPGSDLADVLKVDKPSEPENITKIA